ncbi:hypothetical protein [Legionella clemsonensis]|uniref:Ankyrin repeats (3 copies) n=1 Tax=Legionella clemsonensis TaxID=1867846 RepID=A0A222P6E6_9GAMM|nr:hypothetical protein [Legionella clemsonensis]ASQ47430.1 hypothetical protein clem_14520 [Legionella clemsonensis]
MTDQVTDLLAKAKTLIQKNFTMVLEPSTIKDYVIAMELAQEVEILSDFLTKDRQNFSTNFKAQSGKRAARNAGSSLSLVADPGGFCNQLYWNITQVLFGESQTLGKMLSILQPEITTFIELEFYFENAVKKPKMQDIRMRLCQHPLPELTTIGNVSELTHFVVYKSCLFDVRQIANLSFSLHQMFYQTLKKSYPEMVTDLYRHNNALTTLHQQLQLLDRAGKTPREAISTLVKNFVSGGEMITGATYATAAANQAFYKDFLGYMEALPAIFKSTLLAAATPYGKTLADIVDDLYAGECVELTSEYLEDILKNPANTEILDSYPYLSSEERKALEKQSTNTSLMTMRNDESNGSLPDYYLSQILGGIEIDTVGDWITMLLTCSPTLYVTLLQEVQFSNFPPLELAIALQNLLDDEQHRALENALFINRKRLGLENVFNVGVYLTYQNMLRQLLKSIEANQRLVVLTQFKIKEENILKSLLEFPDSLEVVIQELPANDYIKLCTEVDYRGTPLLQAAWPYTQSMLILINYLSKEHAFKVIMQKDLYGNTALHQAAVDEQVLPRLLEAIPESKRLQAIRERNQRGQTLLSLVKDDPEQIKVILQALPDENKIRQKIELYFIIATLISNIEKGANRRTSGLGSQKITRFYQVQDQLLQEETKDKELPEFMQDVLAICHMKRNPIHFWALPASVTEFLEMAKNKSLPLPETAQLATKRCF